MSVFLPCVIGPPGAAIVRATPALLATSFGENTQQLQIAHLERLGHAATLREAAA